MRLFPVKLLLISLALFFVFAGRLLAQITDWKSFTSVGAIKDIEIVGNTVWSGSNGGVLEFDQMDESFNKITNTESLSSNEVISVAKDQKGTIWFALFNGVLNRLDPATKTFEVFEDYKDQIITDMVSFGDSLYVGLDIGVSLFTIDKKEVKETYKNFGLSSGDVVQKIRANSIFLSGTDIWVSTDKGIAQSSLTLPNLQAPSSWKQFTQESGLPSNLVRKVVVLDSIPYAATTSGVARLVGGQWQLLDAGLNPTDVIAMDRLPPNDVVPHESVVILRPSGVYWLDDSDQWRRLGAAVNDATALKADERGRVWIGREDVGLARYEFVSSDFENNPWVLFQTNSPGSNNFKSLALDSQGRLWCASQRRGIHMFDGQVWTNFSRETGLPSNDYRTVLVDSEGRIWFGSWGGGITIIEDSNDGFKFTKIDTTGGILAGSDTPPFVVINVLKRDNFNNIWALNKFANNTQVLAVNTADGRWGHFSSNEGLGTIFVKSLEIDQFERVWIGTENRGVRVLDYDNTIFDKSDDNFSQGLNTEDGLASDRINALAVDGDGVMWIGTDEGLNFWFSGNVGRRFGLINDNINTIGIDASNNKWVGTVAGLSIVNNNGPSVSNFTAGESPLVSNNVLSLAFNRETGEVWVGTTNGLSRLQTVFTEPKENLSLLSGFPNPFIIDASRGNVFTITNLTANASVRVYDVSGALVRKFREGEILGAQVVWDGRDDDGDLVASGIYVFLAFTQSGISSTGKVAVIRR
ncbi:MAG: two-component regulator propeller domain-containing protein [bacterium]